MAELYIKKIPFFPKLNISNYRKKNQLCGIFKKLGLISNEEAYKFSSQNNINLNNYNKKELQNLFPNVNDNNAIDLIEKFLCVNPEERISILEAKDHPYFDVINNYKRKVHLIFDKKKFEFASEEDIEEMEKKKIK